MVHLTSVICIKYKTIKIEISIKIVAQKTRQEQLLAIVNVVKSVVHLHRKEGGREEEPTNAAEAAPAQGMRIEHTCCCLGVLVGISLIAALVAVILMKDSTVEVTELRQVHVEGKMLTFEMGALLRKRYDEFLGPYYESEKSIVISSDTELSKMTALLIAAGLWPPPAEQLLYEENCPRYKQEKERILKAFTEEGLLLPYRDFFHKIAQMTNTNFSTPQEAYYLNNLFLIQDDIKVANPKWAKHVKRKLMDVARLEYSMMFHNNLLRKLSGGKNWTIHFQSIASTNNKGGQQYHCRRLPSTSGRAHGHPCVCGSPVRSLCGSTAASTRPGGSPTV
ncbi:hypothetical protein HF086_015612 [Spodoptera exigua]|uniref:Uncharacterized protein n=1 Tax=Spodoptera exigua TaxID=7107 RepID=A0A922MQD4_SPOEX|nr:hypothetical protein HF086_015612 [Spodoptera exigua]